MPKRSPIAARKPRLVFCTARPARYAAVLNVLRQTFAITVIPNDPSAAKTFETHPDCIVIENQLVGGDGMWLAQQANALRAGGRQSLIMVAPKMTLPIGRLIEERVIDAAITGSPETGEFLNSFWRAYGTVSEDETLSALSKPAGQVMQSGRQLFTQLEDMTATGGIDLEGRKLVASAAASVVDLAGDPSVAPMLHQLRGHHDSTFAHSLRVGILMASFGRAIGVGDDQLRLMAETGLLHDLGKMRVPLSILAKPGSLTEAERQEMSLHPVYGAQLVNEGYRDLPDLIAAVRHHHEKLDGTGYPDGQTRGQIHEMSLCTAVVDVFSALTDRRDYKEPMERDQAFAIMDTMAGPHLEPRLYRRFRELVLDTRLADEPQVRAAR
ncbi:HD-GYP domain-containing protein [Thalassobaculum salexigens]|uniref:HD-GYP domain-containing protein n=1 Tax=Thalassobaculum salexigens TaxID=455360 RepID=UPI0012EB4106|nr:HD domain-containing phosphohydrolase [Thalassobaculum salexigens]